MVTHRASGFKILMGFLSLFAEILDGFTSLGKTTLLYFWCQNVITDPQPTESFNVETVTRPRIGPLIIWDVTDTSRRRQFYHGTEAIVYVFEYIDSANLTAVKADLKTLLTDRDLHNLPVLLVVSKQDVNGISPEIADNIIKMLELINPRHFACVRTRKDDTDTFRQAIERLCEIIHFDSAF